MTFADKKVFTFPFSLIIILSHFKYNSNFEEECLPLLELLSFLVLFIFNLRPPNKLLSLFYPLLTFPLPDLSSRLHKIECQFYFQCLCLLE